MTKADFAQRCIRHIDDAPCGGNIDTEEPIEGHTRFHFKVTIKTATHWLTAYSTITIFLAWFFFVVDYKDPYHSYGTKCNVVQKQFMYVDGLPSLLNLSQLRAFPNYMMRLGILPTMLIRVFFVCVERWRKHIVEPASLSGKGLRNRLHNLLPALHAVEVFCLSMILILHCKYDHLGFYSVYSICFTASSLLVMGITVYLSALKPDGQFTKDERRFLQISLICLFCYAGSAPLVMDKHLDFVKFFTCSYLVSHIYFFLELVSILSYGAFHYFYCVINIGELEMCVFSEAVELPDEYLTCTPDSSMASSSELRSNETSMFRLSSRQSSLGRNSRNRLTL
ncbi:hypothetical protein L596_027314 [Steinernema carpocapsae]|uniref:Uncharacterized protein n=1 Tax=Steinernema carpocapsae TaxID=34508 RepID=A0A4U5M403_STECR|nr:hypothetical protein L596_027314 [Steinernema carpocapsae]